MSRRSSRRPVPPSRRAHDSGADFEPADVAEIAYRTDTACWDIGVPQPAIRQLVALGAVVGNVLDPGCGTGRHAVLYAKSGCSVVGVDLAPTAISRAVRHAAEADAEVRFEVADATQLEGFEGYFDTVVDSKLFDNLHGGQDRRRYAAALHRATRPGGRLFLFAFGPGDVNGVHNHLLDRGSLPRSVLTGAGWDVTYSGPTTYQLVNRDFQPLCPRCPRVLPDGRMHIPMVEVHAIRPPE